MFATCQRDFLLSETQTTEVYHCLYNIFSIMLFLLKLLVWLLRALEVLLYPCSLEGRLYSMVGVREGAVSGSGFELSEVGGAPVDLINLAGDKVRPRTVLVSLKPT